ncbi:MAG: alginate export family protein [Phycisphaeraceae bacterium]
MRRRVAGIAPLGVVVMMSPALMADTGAVDTPSPVTTVTAEDIESLPTQSADDILKTMVQEGKVHLNIRGRAEIADQDGRDTSEAYTVRTRLGFTTGEYNGMSFHGDFEDIRAADDDRYNAAGLNGQPNRTVIADLEDTELNQLYVNFKIPSLDANLRAGRQRIKLDDDRFIGNVGWRQNEQTFDAIRLDLEPADKVTVNYVYNWDVNRIFGPDANRDFESDSHFIRLSYGDDGIGQFTGFAYLLDFEGEATAAANSSDTFGVRYEGDYAVKGDPEGPKLNYILSYARQSDAGDNPTDYDADYWLADIKYVDNGCYFGAGYELLGSDDGQFGFRTLLATGHKFNGWADVFLVTPADGLEDLYVYVGGNLPAGFKGRAVYHWFDPDEGSADFGEEFDAVVSKQLNENAELLAKYAYYNGGGAFEDIMRFWLQLTLNY